MPWGPIGGVEIELYSFFNLGARVGGGINAPPPPPPPPRCERDPVSIVQEAGWAPGPVWTREGNLAPLPGFDPRAFQRRFTDWAIPTHVLNTAEKSSHEAVRMGGGPTFLLQALHQRATLCGFDVQREFCKKIVCDAEIRIWTKDFKPHIAGMGPKKELCIRYACWVYLLRLCGHDERTCSAVSVVLVSEGLRCLTWASKCLHLP